MSRRPLRQTADLSVSFLVLYCLLFFSYPASAQMRMIHSESDSNNAVVRTNFYSANEGYVAFTKWLGYTTDSGRTYTKAYVTFSNVDYNFNSVNLTFGFGIAGVKAFDRNNLLVYGDYGLVPTILSSTNGGTTWKVIYWSQYVPTELHGGIRDMVFPTNGNIGYAIDADRVLKTTDKGLTWTMLVGADQSYFTNIEALDDNHILVMSTDPGVHRMIRTSDGGASWLPVSKPGIVDAALNYACFLDANTGWVSVGGNTYPVGFYKTTDGGTNWVQLNDPVAQDLTFSKMHFVDANTGYALAGPVYKTLNGGVTWEPLSGPDPFSYFYVGGQNYSSDELQVYSPDQLWMGGGHGFLALSTNGGGTPLPKAYFRVDTTGVFATGTVNLLNYSRTGYSYRWLVNGQAVSTSYNATYTHDVTRLADSVQLIVTGGGVADTLERTQYFFVPVFPKVTGFSPAGGGAGTQVTITGSGFTNVTGLSFGGVPAASYTIVNDGLIVAVVGNGATGSVVLSDLHGRYAGGAFQVFPVLVGSQPVISAVQPAAGVVGSTVTISGTGFATTVTDNAVSFGSIAATVQSATATSIVCKVPAGASFAPITVRNKNNGLQTQSPQPFNIPFADSSNFTPNSFTPAFSETFTENIYGGALRGADIDGDGKPDLVGTILEPRQKILAVYPNTSVPGKISFGPRVNADTVPLGSQLGWFEVGDVDGDGLVDVVGTSNAGFVLVMRNRSRPGSIAWDPVVSVPTMDGSQTAVIADLDNDGKNDLAVATYNYSGVSILRNTGIPGAIAFAPAQNMSAGGNCYQIATGDLDGDGRLDLATLDYHYNGTSNLTIFRNTSVPGTISFVRTDIALPGAIQDEGALRIADMDGDGKPDVFLQTDNATTVFRNIGTVGTIAFASPSSNAFVNVLAQGGSLANYGGGAVPDPITGAWVDAGFYALRNHSQQGATGFLPPVKIPGGYTYFTSAADFDGDGRADLAAVYATYFGTFAVLRNGIGTPIDLSVCASNPNGTRLMADLSGTNYQWQENRGGGFKPIIDNDSVSGAATATLFFAKVAPAWTGYRYRCVVDGLYSATWALKVNNASSPGISLAATDSVICYRNMVDFTAAAINPGNAYFISGYTWLVDDTAYYDVAAVNGNRLYDNSLHDGDRVRAVINYYDVCGGMHSDTSRAITMRVTTPTVQITASDTTICAGTPVTFTSATTNVQSSAIYRWSISTSNDKPATVSFTTADLNSLSTIQLSIDLSAQCGHPTSISSNAIRMTVGDTARPLVNIAASRTAICAGDAVSFTATETGGGSAPGYGWLINGQPVQGNGTRFNSAGLQNNDRVQCAVTSSEGCNAGVAGVSLPVIVQVSPVVIPAVSIVASDTVICSGAAISFTATPVNGGDLPHYQWLKDGVPVGNDAAGYHDQGFADGDVVAVRLVSSAGCARPDTVLSRAMTIGISKLTPVLRISGDTTTGPGLAVMISAAVTNGVGVSAWQWQDSTRSHSWQAIAGATGASIDHIFSDYGDRIRVVTVGVTGCLGISNMLTEGGPVNGRSDGLRYFPNPARTTLTLANTRPADAIVGIDIADARGMQVGTWRQLNLTGSINLGVAGLNPGMYFVTVTRFSGARSSFSFMKL